ncbi:MAG: 1-deoxy-D-xylulose-5-phosphate reductoisomerase [Deltaproteobacteria bacterium]|nr:1-deoxy-D-xylulose-5-phosphate reductoisomerase [Deltaproteobacteria bacterium]
MKRLSILGSTGSIGCNTFEIAGMFPDLFDVKAIAAKSNVSLLAEQIQRFSPELAVVFDEARAQALKKLLPLETDVRILYGKEGYRAAATIDSVDTVVAAMVGAAGLMPTMAAIESGKNIALANKETLVMAGEIVMQHAADKGVDILPVDSEHSAIFQCLEGNRREDLDKILLTGSGGPFLKRSKREFSKIKVEDALNHPVWRMGKKISIDSATLMNKGLEVIEAKNLFNVSARSIEVVIHPQGVIHSMVAYIDGSVIAQLGITDMKGAIAYAMSFPERLPLRQPLPDFVDLGKLTFEPPDLEKFPCLALAYKACEIGGTCPAVLNAANEVAVHAFLEKQISFLNIPEINKEIMARHSAVANPILSDILEADQWARDQAEQVIDDLQKEGA